MEKTMDIVVCQSRGIDTMPTAFSTVPQQTWICRLSTASTAVTANIPFRSIEIQRITIDSSVLGSYLTVPGLIDSLCHDSDQQRIQKNFTIHEIRHFFTGDIQHIPSNALFERICLWCSHCKLLTDANHYIQCKKVSSGRVMSGVLGEYASFYNWRHPLTGNMFKERYKSWLSLLTKQKKVNTLL